MHRSIAFAFMRFYTLSLFATGIAEKSENPYSKKTITMIIPYGAGGTTDISGRQLEKHLGKSNTVINQGGASISIGTRTVPDAKSDGCTILFTAESLGADCIVAVLGKQVDFTNSNHSTVTGCLESGDFTLLWISVLQRLEAHPEVLVVFIKTYQKRSMTFFEGIGFLFLSCCLSVYALMHHVQARVEWKQPHYWFPLLIAFFLLSLSLSVGLGEPEQEKGIFQGKPTLVVMITTTALYMASMCFLALFLAANQILFFAMHFSPMDYFLLGLFGLTTSLEDEEVCKVSMTPIPIKELLHHAPLSLWYDKIDVFAGVLPGAGGPVAAFLAYSQAKRVMLPLVAVLCVIGSFAANNRIFDVILMFFFGLLGFSMRRRSYSVAPMTLAIVQGGMMDSHFRRTDSLASSEDLKLPALFGRIITIILLLLVLGTLVSNSTVLKPKRNHS